MLTYVCLMRGMLTQFAAATAANGTNLPTKGGVDCKINKITLNTQTAVINIINLRIIYKLDVSYASQHTFSKVTVTIF